MVVLEIPSTTWSYCSGIIAAIAWLLLLDAQIYDAVVFVGDKGHPHQFEGWYWTLVLLPTIGWLILNAPDFIYNPRNDVIAENSEDAKDNRVRYALGRITIAVGFFFLFAGCMQGIIFMIIELIVKSKKKKDDDSVKLYVWNQIVCFVFPAMIVVSAFLFFIGRVFGDRLKIGQRRSDDDDY